MKSRRQAAFLFVGFLFKDSGIEGYFQYPSLSGLRKTTRSEFITPPNQSIS